MTYYGKVCFTLRIDVMGVGFDNLTKSEFTAKAEDMLEKKERGYVVTPNAEIVYESIHDDGFRALLNDASMVLPDGAGVVLGAKILGTPIKEKVAGIEFGEEVCKLLARNNGRLYLLGSKPGIAKAAGEKLAAKYPGLVICGVADGYFKDEKAVIEKINEAKPDVLFVCLGAPKQEKFIKEHFEELDVTMNGILLDETATPPGVAQRAPKWMIDLSLEWLYRLLKEPKRLGRMMRLPKFVLACGGEKLRRKRNG